MSAYLDASVLVPLFVEQAHSQIADRFLREHDDQILVGDFAAAEFASAMSRLVRMAMLDAVAASSLLADFDVWRSAMTEPVECVSSDLRLASLFVRRFELMLRAPDALHAAICQRMGASLVTLDRRLADAARELSINALVPGAS